MATDDMCQCSDGGQFFNPENWTTSEACHRCGKPGRTTLNFPSRSVPVGTGEIEKLLDKVSEEKGEGAVRAARTQPERLQNPRCQRQECIREREAVDRLEKKVTGQSGALKALVEVLEEARTRKSTVAVWMEDGREVSLEQQINAAILTATELL